MTEEQLDHLLSRDPFVPLRLHLTDGRKIDIHNPGLAFINRLALYVFRVDRPDSHIVDDHHLIALRHIVSIEQVVTPNPS